MAAGPLMVAVFLKLCFGFSSGGSCVCFTVQDSQWCPEGNQMRLPARNGDLTHLTQSRTRLPTMLTF